MSRPLLRIRAAIKAAIRECEGESAPGVRSELHALIEERIDCTGTDAAADCQHPKTAGVCEERLAERISRGGGRGAVFLERVHGLYQVRSV